MLCPLFVFSRCFTGRLETSLLPDERAVVAALGRVGAGFGCDGEAEDRHGQGENHDQFSHLICYVLCLSSVDVLQEGLKLRSYRTNGQLLPHSGGFAPASAATVRPRIDMVRVKIMISFRI